MTKNEVEQKHLSNYVIMPGGVETAFNKWWRSLESSFTIQVRIHQMNDMVMQVKYRTQLRQRYEMNFFYLSISTPSQMVD